MTNGNSIVNIYRTSCTILHITEFNCDVLPVYGFASSKIDSVVKINDDRKKKLPKNFSILNNINSFINDRSTVFSVCKNISFHLPR